MKSKYHKAIAFLLILFVFSGCELIPISSPMPLSTDLPGRWEWVKTVTPTKIYTPETEGYNEDISFSFGNSDQVGYVVIYRNDSLRENYLQNRSKGASVNVKENSITNYYRPSKLIKVYLKFDEQGLVNHIETTPLLQEYSSKADTIRYYYERISYEPLPFK